MPRWTVWLSAAALVAATVAAYSNSFNGAMVFDDRAWILENGSIQSLSSIGEVLFPRNAGLVGGRPVVSLTLALNYALGGTNPFSYHLVNLCIHVYAGLVLFGIVRRTLVLPALRDRFGAAATSLALAVALIWAVHPLQTSAVTYIIQRTESMMGLLYLLTLYCVIRGATVPATASAKKLLWYTVALVSCLLGMMTKEVMFTAPLLVVLYDWFFLSGSLRSALRERGGLYAGLAATWSFGLLMILITGFHAGTIGPAVETFTWLTYLQTQPGVILHYLQMALWPSGLCLDYNWPPAETIAQIVVPGTIIIAMLGLTIWGLVKRSPLGFLAAAFFLILAPTSSLIPIKDAAFDHRMYLPLAAVVAMVVFGAYSLWNRIVHRLEEFGTAEKVICWGVPAALLMVATVALGWATIARNDDFRSEEAIWRDVIAKRPDNWRAFANLGYLAMLAERRSEAIELFTRALQLNQDEPQVHLSLGNAVGDEGKTDEAIYHYERALRLEPTSAKAHYNLGVALAKKNKTDDAIVHYRKAARLDPDYAEAHNNLADLLLANSKFDEAIKQAEAALALKPDYALAHNNLAVALMAKGRFDEAIANFRKALEINPRLVEAEYPLAAALANSGRFDEAINYFEKDLKRKPDDVEAHFNLGSLYDKTHQTDKAIAEYERVLELNPDHKNALLNLGAILEARGNLDDAIENYNKVLRISDDAALQIRIADLYVRQGQLRQAVVHYESALISQPRNAVVHFELADCFRAQGKLDDAIEHYRQAIEIQPDHSAAHNNLAGLLAQQGKMDEALVHFEKAIELNPKHADAHYKLGMIFYSKNKEADAAIQWREAVRLRPDQPTYIRQLALLLAIGADSSVRNGAEAIKLAQRGVELTDRLDPDMLGTLAAAYAEARRFPEAVATAEQARDLATLQKKSGLADELSGRLRLYRAGSPYHEKAK